MNIANFIFNYLKQSYRFTNIFLVPGFEPVVREEEGEIKKILDIKLTDKDVREILIALRNTASIPKLPSNKEIFSFGIPEIGRIRVSYFLQRGSYVVNIIKTPFIVPDPTDIFENFDEFLDLYNDISDSNTGTYLILGNRWLANSILAYSILKLINKNYKKIICTLENPISFLLKHGNSIVIQRDIQVDASSAEEAIKDIYFLDPDIIYYSSSVISDNIKELEYLDLYKLNIISFPFSSYDIFMKRLYNSTSLDFSNLLKKYIKKVITVRQTSSTKDKLMLSVENISMREI